MLFKYKGFHGCDCVCDIEVYDNIVIATEISQNEGTSITNVAEDLAKQVCDKFAIQYDLLTWIEHYPRRLGMSETFDLVKFNVSAMGFDSPEWKRISREGVEKLIGHKLPYRLEMTKEEAKCVKELILNIDHEFYNKNKDLIEAINNKVDYLV